MSQLPRVAPRYLHNVAEDAGGRIRVGTTEREAAMKALGQHLETGHLDVDEYTERIGRAATARTVADLDNLFLDLPAPSYRPQPPPPPVYQPQPAGFPATHLGYWPLGPVPVSDKSKLTAGLLQILLPFGVGRFYTGHYGMAFAQLFLSLLWVGVIWSIIDGIIILAQGGHDRYGHPLR